jgi:hypothetical protein
LDLGVGTDVVHSLSAFVDGVDVRVDLAEINSRVFVNNASMGACSDLRGSDPRHRPEPSSWRFWTDRGAWAIAIQVGVSSMSSIGMLAVCPP